MTSQDSNSKPSKNTTEIIYADEFRRAYPVAMSNIANLNRSPKKKLSLLDKLPKNQRLAAVASGILLSGLAVSCVGNTGEKVTEVESTNTCKVVPGEIAGTYTPEEDEGISGAINSLNGLDIYEQNCAAAALEAFNQINGSSRDPFAPPVAYSAGEEYLIPKVIPGN